jgi:phosphoribosyl 1,2-cyclic phosphodiesterase
MKSFKIKFWGVRGSIPTPGKATFKYGGNTSCVELQCLDGPFIILDAGTGIRELGKFLLDKKNPVNAYIFLTHFHWDHIQGLPFFRPAFDPHNSFTIVGSDDAAIKLDQIISFQMDPTYFPITIEDMQANIQFRSIKEQQFEIDGAQIQTIYLNHPGYALGYRITYNNKSVIYISDNEPFNYPTDNLIYSKKYNSNKIEDIFENLVEDKEKKLIHFCMNADVLIHDSQFFQEEYLEKVAWGHSPFNYTVQLAMKSLAKKLILFHHDPDHDDKTIDHLETLSKQILKNANQSMDCFAAREGMVIYV